MWVIDRCYTGYNVESFLADALHMEDIIPAVNNDNDKQSSRFYHSSQKLTLAYTAYLYNNYSRRCYEGASMKIEHVSLPPLWCQTLDALSL